MINRIASKEKRFSGIKSDYVLGHGTDDSARFNKDNNMKGSQQNMVLRDFRQNRFNVLVSTSVVEEGLDVRQCNLVVRFDGLEQYREYAQSKGRARSKNSKFIVMTECEESTKEQMKVSGYFFFYHST